MSRIYGMDNTDQGVGFDMRNAQVLVDSDDEDELLDSHAIPKLYIPEEQEKQKCTCQYCIIIILIIILGSTTGYLIGSALAEPYKPDIDPLPILKPNYGIPNHDNNNINTQNHTPYPTNSPTQKPTIKPSINSDESTITAPTSHSGKRKHKQNNVPNSGIQAPSTHSKIQAPSVQSVIKAPSAQSQIKAPSAHSQSKIQAPSAHSDESKIKAPSAHSDDATQTHSITPAPSMAQKKKTAEPTPKRLSEKGKTKQTKVNTAQTVANTDSSVIAKPLTMSDDEMTMVGNGKLLTRLTSNGMDSNPVYLDSHTFSVEYPPKNDNYNNNEYRTWCFNVHLFEYESAQIDIKFKSFQMERGFDRVLVRNFNQSYVDPPFVIAGRGAFDEVNDDWMLPKTLTYHVWKNEFKTVCVEMETDDSVTMQGIAFDVIVRYDPCQWSQWTDCSIPDESDKYWARGPWYDGRCGIGVHSKSRSSGGKDDFSDAFVGCVNDNEPSQDTLRPEYCLKKSCEFISNDGWKMPKKIKYGWSDYNSFFNGIGTLTPDNPDLLRILTAHPSTPTHFKSVDDVTKYMSSPDFTALYQSFPFYKVNPNEHIFDLDHIIKSLKAKRTEIVSEHTEEMVLQFPLLDIKYLSKTKEWFGARLAHSLLIGRAFTFEFTGSSNTAGHDNQFQSSFSMQLQSRLRQLWTDIGVDGAAMNVRNIAVGGSPNTKTMAWHVHTRASETVGYPFNGIEGGMRLNSDVVFWESFMNDGGNPDTNVMEEQLRSTALLNAIWGSMNSIGMKDKCEGKFPKPFNALSKPLHLTKGNGNYFDKFSEVYGPVMGLLEFDFSTFLHAICNEKQYKVLKINWHPNARGHRLESDVYAYNALTFGIEFLETNKDHINALKGNADTGILDSFLMAKSGNWGDSYVKSMLDTDSNAFPNEMFCAPFCDKTVAPFALKTVEPYEYDVGFRMHDYVMNSYVLKSKNGDITSEAEGFKKNGFDVADLVKSNHWKYADIEKDHPHFPQDRNGRIGAMDRKAFFCPIKQFFENSFQIMLKGIDQKDYDVMTSSMGSKKGVKYIDGKGMEMLGKYAKQFGEYVLDNGYDLKIAIEVPKIGANSLLLFTGERDRHFFNTKDPEPIVGVYLTPMKEEDKNSVDKQFGYDFSKPLLEQRECKLVEKNSNCYFDKIPSGKFILSWYPVNMTAKGWSDGKGCINGLVAF